jgi:hypothetical protein
MSAEDYDFGPWIEVQQSTRLSRFRYDYAQGRLVVTWRTGKGHVHTTSELGAPVEVEEGEERPTESYGATTYRKFAIAVSKGKYVNNILNAFDFDVSTPDDLAAPSNPDRRTVKTIDTNSQLGSRGAR